MDAFSKSTECEIHMTYYRLFQNSGLSVVYSDGVTYQIDWVLVGMGGCGSVVLIND